MKISVVTICYNNKNGLRKTIESVINQTYRDIEFIIVDGNSNDGSFELVQEYKKIFPINFIYEADEGIYDAMNKGVDVASGDWIIFMNSGDIFYKNNTIDEAIKELDNNFNIIYGDTEIVYKDFKAIKKEPEPNKLWMGRIPHQSSFINTLVMKKYKYNKENRIVADLEFFMNVYYKEGKIKKINKIISSFSKDGVTEKMGCQVILDAYKTVKQFKQGFLVDLYYNILKIKPIIKNFLPKKIFKLIKTKTNL